MAGLPSGSDSTHYDVGYFGRQVANLSGLADLTQTNVQNHYKDDVQGSSSWNSASATMYGGLDPSLPWPVAFLKAIAEALIGAVIGGVETVVDILEAIAGWVFNSVLGPSSPINPLNIFGSIIHLITGVPIGAITNTQPNLLIDPVFDTNALPAGGRWSIDTTVTHSADKSGSAKVIANRIPTALRSGRSPLDVFTVTEGQKLQIGVWMKHQGLSMAGVPVRLQLVTFSGGKRTDFIDLVQYTPESTPDIDWKELTAEYDVPVDVDAVQLRIFITKDASSGTLWFDDASLKLVNTIQPSWIEGLVGILDGILGRTQNLFNTIYRALTGQTNLLTSIEDIFLALINIPFGNVLGVGGPENIGASIQAFFDHLVSGFVGVLDIGAGLADVFNISHMVSSWAKLGQLAFELLGIRNNTPVYTGLLPNGKSNYPITGINTNLSCTQAASLIATYRIGESSPLGVVSWLGCGTTSMTAFYVNIWKINETNGNWSLAHHSPNILGDIVGGTTANWNFYELAVPLAVVAGEQYAFELVPVGGTHTVRGYSTADTIPDHPYANIVSLAATRNNTSSPNSPPTSISKASITKSGNVPWIEVAIDTGTGSNHHDPIVVYMTESGTVPIPSWAQYIEVIALGAGGGGHAGGLFGFYGEGGNQGKWKTAVWERGVDFDDGVANISFTCGVGGGGGSFIFGPGGAGTASIFSIPGRTASGSGGAGGASLQFGLHTKGIGAGSITFNGQQYAGGDDQNVYSSGGCSPGGGAAGGNWLTASGGGTGGKGAGWIRFIQGDLGTDEPDTTPPTKPTVTVDEVTFSTVTITATGSVDP